MDDCKFCGQRMILTQNYGKSEAKGEHRICPDCGAKRVTPHKGSPVWHTPLFDVKQTLRKG